VAEHIGLPEELSEYFSLFIQDANEFNHQYCCNEFDIDILESYFSKITQNLFDFQWSEDF
jgi:hypothetical protein